LSSELLKFILIIIGKCITVSSHTSNYIKLKQKHKQDSAVDTHLDD